MSEKKPLKVLRGITVALMGLTVLFTLMGGAGTSCVAFGAENYESMIALVPYKPLYQLLVALSLAAGVWGILITIALVRGGRHAYRNALLMLLAGAVTAGVQMGVSQAVRGAAAPVNVRFYLTVFTLLVFLLLALPGIRKRLDFSQPFRDGKASAGGTTLIVCGVVMLTTRWWAAPTHTAAWIDVLRTPLMLCGWGMVLLGAGLLQRAMAPSRKPAAAVSAWNTTA